MSLAYVILGLLQQEGRTGYDLKVDCFDHCIAHLWQADQAQIYRTLDRLETQGWIHCTIKIQHDRPNRKVYDITEIGKGELNQWLQTHQPLPVLREPLLVQLYFAAELPSEAIATLLEQELVVRQQKLVECSSLNVPCLGDRTATLEQQLHRLALDLMIQREQTYLDWLQRAIEFVRNQYNSTLS